MSNQAPAPPFMPAHARQWWPDFINAGNLYGVPPALLAAVAKRESAYDPTAESSKGAEGMMQLIPRFYPGVDPMNPKQAIPAAASSLASYHQEFGTWRAALAAYNEGPGNYRAYGISNPETIGYVNDIGGWWGGNLDA